ncbi:hypothetical protein ACEWY4_027173 [Coilia grayii]|uniref:Centromere protein U n=1 Tax=Coilia grayii TaxID=363190 RepID=A0ABD1IRN5_9TELE
MSQKTKIRKNVKQGGKDELSALFGEACPDLSSIEKDSIFHNDPSNSDGNPLHSTAMEDDFSPVITRQKTTPLRKKGAQTPAGTVGTPRRVTGATRRPSTAKGGKSREKANVKQGKGMEKRPQNLSPVFKAPSVPPLSAKVMASLKTRQMRKISEESETQGMSASGTLASQVPSQTQDTDASSEEETDSEDPTSGGSIPVSASRRKSQPVLPSRQEAGEGPSNLLQKKTGGRRESQGSQGSATQKQPRKSSGKVNLHRIPEENEKQPRTSDDPETSDSLSDEGSISTPPGKKRNRGSLQEEEEEESSAPPKTARGQRSRPSSGSRQKRGRKSTSASSDEGARSKQRKGTVRNPVDLEVILLHFLDFVEQYKETVDSSAVQKAIDYMSESFVEQLTEMITATKDLTTVKKKNMKLNTAINRKRSSLLDAKNELIQSEAKTRAVQKEREQLQQRLTDLTNGMTLLRDLTDLHTKYAAHCEAHPEQPVVYGPASLPALLLEARCMLGAEHQLKTINAKLQEVLDDVNQK